MRAGDEKWLWQWPPPGETTTHGPTDVGEILSAGKTYPATIAVATTDGMMIGLAGPTGKMRWRYNAATPSGGSVLATDDPQGLPRIWNSSPVSPRRCGIALPTDEAGKYQPLPPRFVKYDEPARNPRLLRSLPWNGRPLGAPLLAWLVYIVVSVVLLGLAVGKRSGKLRRGIMLIALWLIVSLLWAIAWLSLEARNMSAMQHYDWNGWYRIFFFGFSLTMLLLFAGLVAVGLFHFVRWTVRRLTKTPV